MNQDQFINLKVGDLVTNMSSGHSYTIIYKVNDGCVGMKTVAITSPEQWELFRSPPAKPDPFEEWYNLAALPRRACGYDYDELRKAYMAGMKSKPQ